MKAKSNNTFLGLSSWNLWQGKHRKYFFVDLYNSLIHFRYDSKGSYLGSLPELTAPRRHHACTTFTTAQGEQVEMWCLNFISFACQSGLASCWRICISIQYRNLSTINKPMGARCSTSKVVINSRQIVKNGLQWRTQNKAWTNLYNS